MYKLLSKYYNAETQKFAADVFENLLLPTPGKRECSNTSDFGQIIFVNSAACVIRFTLKTKTLRLEHPHILQPVFSRQDNLFLADIFPGIASPVAPEDHKKLIRNLKKDGIRFNDCINENAGYLPIQTKEFPNGFPVVLDPCAYNQFLFPLRTLKTRMEKAGLREASPAQKPDMRVQTEPFGALKDAFSRAWPNKHPSSDPAAMAESWDLCAAMKQNGILIDNWTMAERMPLRYMNVPRKGKHYEERCRFFGPQTSAAFAAPIQT